jgi:hypothetical protein
MQLSPLWESDSHPTSEEGSLSRSLEYAMDPIQNQMNPIHVFIPSFFQDLLQSQSYFATGGLPPISLSWCQAPWDSRPDIFFQLNPCGFKSKLCYDRRSVGQAVLE